MPLDSTPDTRLERADPDLNPRCGSIWAVAQTHPQAERWAAANLTRQGYATYLPLLRVRRRDPIHRTISRLVDVPLWSGYLFVVPGSHWAPIRHTQGVARLLLVDGQPGRVGRGIVEHLRASEDARLRLAEPGGWTPGTACRIASGPFAGHDGAITAVAGDAARVGVMLFGHVREVEISTHCLEAR